MAKQREDPRIQKLIEAHADAVRFVRLAGIAKKALGEPDASYSSKEFAAAKRASMDLTRSLADLRKPAQ